MNQPIIESNKPERDCKETKHKQQLMDEIQTELESDLEESLTAEGILSTNQLQVIEIELTAGGPTEWLRIYGNDGKIVEATHHYSYGMECEDVNLTESEIELLSKWIDRYIPGVTDQFSCSSN